jgi:Tol biopolymer transport system component
MWRCASVVLIGMTAFCAAQGAGADPILAGRILNPVTNAEPVAGTQGPAVSGDGRFIFFVSSSNNLGPGANGALNLYRADLSAATAPENSLVLAMFGLGNGNCFAPSSSNSGTVVAFETLATNLGGNQGGQSDVYASFQIPLPQGEVGFDTLLVSRGLAGAAPNGASRYAATSADGRFVAFWSDASNLVINDTNAAPDIFIANVDGGMIGPVERVSVDSSELQVPGWSRALSNHALSADGRYVVFAADATMDGASPTTIEDVYLRDRTAGTTTLQSRFSNGTPFTGSADQPSISPNARYVAFRSFQNGAGIGTSRIFLRDRQNNTTLNIATPPTAASCAEPRVSNQGDIAMNCASSLVGVSQQLWYRRASDGALFRLSSTPANVDGNGASGTTIDLSDDGAIIAFDSAASNLDPGDGNNSQDVFVGIEESVLYAIFSDGFE